MSHDRQLDLSSISRRTVEERDYWIDQLVTEVKRLRAAELSPVAARVKQQAEWFRWLRDNPQAAAFTAVLVAKHLPHGPALDAVMDSGEVVGVMEDAKHPEFRFTATPCTHLDGPCECGPAGSGLSDDDPRVNAPVVDAPEPGT